MRFLDKFEQISNELDFLHYKKFSDYPCFLNACYYFILFGMKDIKNNNQKIDEDLLKLQYFFYSRYRNILTSLKGKTEDYNTFLENYYSK